MPSSPRSTRWLKLAARVLTFLLIGAAIDWAIAWGASLDWPLWQRPPVQQILRISLVDILDQPEWPGEMPPNWPSRPVYADHYRSLTHTYMEARYPYWHGEPPSRHFAIVYNGFGFPSRSWAKDHRYTANGHEPRVWIVDYSALGFTEQGFPIIPSWRGIAVNSVTYAVACAAIVYAARLARRWRRRRTSSSCQHCGYDCKSLPANVPCPECGNSPQSISGQPHA